MLTAANYEMTSHFYFLLYISLFANFFLKNREISSSFLLEKIKEHYLYKQKKKLFEKCQATPATVDIIHYKFSYETRNLRCERPERF